MDVAKGRGSQKIENVTEQEKAVLRTTVYQFKWLGKESCPTVAGTASLLASRLEQATRQRLKTSSLPMLQFGVSRTPHQ